MKPIDINYGLDTHSKEWMYMMRVMRCWRCGNPLDETVTDLGTMLTCTADAKAVGREGDSIRYESVLGCGTRWWIDEG